MFTRNSTILLTAVLSVPLLAISACSDDDAGAGSAEADAGGTELADAGSNAVDAAPPGDTDGAVSSLASDLSQLREEEKLARDVYITLYAEWGTSVFQNISGSEQSHMDSVGGLLELYGIADPIVDDTVGVFVNTDLASLYTTLVAQGMQSQAEALQVGATIEDLDIFDIRAMRTRTSDAAVIEVYDLLECGSNNHMRSFNKQITNQGGSYTAQFLTQAEVDAIHCSTAGAMQWLTIWGSPRKTFGRGFRTGSWGR